MRQLLVSFIHMRTVSEVTPLHDRKRDQNADLFKVLKRETRLTGFLKVGSCVKKDFTRITARVRQTV